MKKIITLCLLLNCSNSFSQWTRVQQLPSSDIASLYHKDNILYAGGKNIIYFSRDKGLTWDSTSSIPQLFLVTSIIVYKNELYAAAPRRGVFKSRDGGITWEDVSNGIFNVSDFCEYRGDLFAATLGDSIYKLDSADRNSWLHFNNGLSSISNVATAIVGNSNALVAGTNNNGLYNYLPANATTWEERFLLDRVTLNEGAYDIITAHDTLFYAGYTGEFYLSTDNGLNWEIFGNRLVSAETTIVNAREALLTSVHFFDGIGFNTAFFYLKKDLLHNPFVNFSVVENHFTYKTDIMGKKLWDASDRGLFFMPLSNLPGITAADDSAPIVLPVRFISFTANCESNKLVLNWKTAQEQNSNRFDIERNVDVIHWTVIGSKPAAGNSNVERSYSFTDNSPLQNNLYRIVEYDLDGRALHTDILRSSCNTTDLISVWPNPVHDAIFINIVTSNVSQATINIFDSKGTLVKTQKANLLKGSNQFNADMKLLANGVYHLSVNLNSVQMKKMIQIVKQ